MDKGQVPEGAQNRPMVQMTFERAVCDRHGEPFRAEWPRGWIIFQVKLLHSVLHSEEFRREAQERFGDMQVQHIEAMLDDAPACCRVAITDLRAAYMDSGIGRAAICRGCKQIGQGTEYRVRLLEGGTDVIPHLCFECVMRRMRKRSNDQGIG